MAQIQTKFIANNAVTNAKLAQAPALTLKGNNTGSTANEQDLTVAQVQAMLGVPTTLSPLPLNQGGTGVSAASANAAFNALSPMTTAGDIIYENATPAAARLGIGSTGQVLTVVAGLPAWATPATSGTVTSVALADASSSPIYSISGSPVTSSGTLTLTLSTQSANTVFAGPTTGAAAQPTFRALVSADIPSLSAIYLPLAGGTMSGDINMGSHSITSLATPVNPNDAVTKAYVDNFINATSWKQAVLVATTANITLSGEQTIDGFLTSSSRVLVKNQSAPADNGIYVSAAGAWSRSTDMNTWAEVPAAAVFVQEGTVNADIGFVCTSQPGGTLGTTAITWVQFSSAGAYSADGVTLQLISGVFSVKNNGISNTQLAQMPAHTYKGNNTGSTANAIDVTNTQLTADLNLFTSSLQGLVPASGGGTTNFLRADGTFATPSGTGVSTIGTFNSQASSANGLVISGTTLYAQAATTTNPGMIIAPAAGGLALSSGSLSLNTDNSTVKINGSNALEALQPKEQQFTLSGGDITNQYVDLAFVAFGASASDNSVGVYVIGGPEQQKTVDYTVSLTGGSGGVTRIAFAGDLATGGNAALIAGDILVVDYSRLA